jgi:preprotein translocase subunit YajC
MNNAVMQQLIMFGSIFAIIYFIMIRPQQQEKKKHEAAVLAIKKGDEIVTAGGLVGEVVHVKNVSTEGSPSLADRVTIRSGESRVVIERGRIARIAPAGTPSAPATKSTGSGSAS